MIGSILIAFAVTYFVTWTTYRALSRRDLKPLGLAATIWSTIAGLLAFAVCAILLVLLYSRIFAEY